MTNSGDKGNRSPFRRLKAWVSWVTISALTVAYRHAAAQRLAEPSTQPLDDSAVDFRSPRDLGPFATPRRVRAIGTCLLDDTVAVWSRQAPQVTFDFHLFVNPSGRPLAPKADYDFHVVQFGLQQVLADDAFFRLDYSDQHAFEAFYDQAADRLRRMADDALGWNIDGRLTFVLGFVTPQQDPRGRLLGRYDLRNLVFVIEQLNKLLEELARARTNTHFVDFDAIVASYGKRGFLDDSVWPATHGGALSDWNADSMEGDRLDHTGKLSQYYELTYPTVMQALWQELLANYTAITGMAQVKVVLWDLDDTLWRGVAADGHIRPLAGWPKGLMEALHVLKSRGVLLGVVSKNDEAFVRQNWRDLTEGLVNWDDFVVHRVNWLPKPENILEIARLLNVGVDSIVMVDDNPRERAEISEALPDVRVIGSNPYHTRRIVLWSPQTQRPVLTRESVTRHLMVQRQIERESDRSRMSHAEFLRNLNVRVLMYKMSPGDADWSRVLELFNKTNQLNTGDQRYTEEEFRARIGAPNRLIVMQVQDIYTKYGLVGAAIVSSGGLEHVVMSCRIMGIGAEEAFFATLLGGLPTGVAPYVRWKATAKNEPCIEILGAMGFEEAEPGLLRLTEGQVPSVPPHVTVSEKTSALAM